MTMKVTSDEYLSIVDIMTYIGRSEHYVRKYLSNPDAPTKVPSSISGRRGISYLKSDIDTWLKSEFGINFNKVQEVLLLSRRFNPVPKLPRKLARS